jgi:RHS repeat-associated protein
MTAVNGAVVWAVNYEAFGKSERDPNSSVTNNLRFPGQYYDSETDQHYNYHRYYYPKVGRYLTEDPIKLEGGMNLFLYGENDPISMVDNLGLISYEGAKSVPKYGKWCGPFYGGGKALKVGEDPDWHVPPDDSLDECCYRHDKCYDINRVTADAAPDNCEKIKCDKELIECMKGLPENPAIWPSPPKLTRSSKFTFPRLEPTEYTTARQYKMGAAVAFQAEQNKARGKECP